MRLLQNIGVYPDYLKRLDGLCGQDFSYKNRVRTLIHDRYSATHILKPILDDAPDAMLTLGLDRTSQIGWAKSKSFKERNLRKILLAQIEDHKADVFYNQDPITFDDSFIANLPGCVKKVIGWRAAPSNHSNFHDYDLIISNFPGILAGYALKGIKTAYFSPAYDPVMGEYLRNDRSIDLIFSGSFSRHHATRNDLLNLVIKYSDRLNIEMYIHKSRLTKLTDHIWLPKIIENKFKISDAINKRSRFPVFGRDAYEIFGNSKIIFNAGVDMSGGEKGNMRCFEALGCGALLLSDSGLYPDGMIDGKTIKTYKSKFELENFMDSMVGGEWQKYNELSNRGHEMVKEVYSKAIQFRKFQELI